MKFFLTSIYMENQIIFKNCFIDLLPSITIREALEIFEARVIRAYSAVNVEKTKLFKWELDSTIVIITK